MSGREELSAARLSGVEALSKARTQHGESLAQLANRAPHLVIFLRHLGCTFCREALAEVASRRRAIESGGAQIAFVHMGTEELAAPLFARFGLAGVARVSDPDAQLYRAFALHRGQLSQVAGPRVWWRGLRAVLAGFRPGRWVGDTLQMPGVFLVHRGEILRAFRHQYSSDRPDYEALSVCEVPKS